MVAPAVLQSLTYLLNLSLRAGQVPSELKEANITPVPKAGEKDDVNNYWSISAIPIIAKCFESLIHDQLHKYNDGLEQIAWSVVLLFPTTSFYTQDVLVKSIDDWKVGLDAG